MLRFRQFHCIMVNAKITFYRVWKCLVRRFLFSFFSGREAPLYLASRGPLSGRFGDSILHLLLPTDRNQKWDQILAGDGKVRSGLWSGIILMMILLVWFNNLFYCFIQLFNLTLIYLQLPSIQPFPYLSLPTLDWYYLHCCCYLLLQCRRYWACKAFNVSVSFFRLPHSVELIRWKPPQLAGWLRCMYSYQEIQRIYHKWIYQCLYQCILRCVRSFGT